MFEDRHLLKRFKSGSRDALCEIYQKYENYLLSLAVGLLGDTNSAEDVMHDVFCKLIHSKDSIKLHGSLKGYLGTCVVNRARDGLRQRKRLQFHLEPDDSPADDTIAPDHSVIRTEETRRLCLALVQVPYDQREVIVLRLKGDMKYRQIATCLGISINTAKSRYRYGLNKLRSILLSKDDLESGVSKNETI
ncbi:MAG: sigma-70 family RNA polymerase sigma factor [Phycisphaerae bacterium]|nr:sigma-70 family RNA polymerase sigma factor [Phycisphaerae bacterium]